MQQSAGRKNTLSVILGGGRGVRLYPLTKLRAKPAVPLGGKYRLIDVPISNCLNSGINQIYLLTQFQSTSLHRHIESTYRFDRFGGGFIEILAAQQTHESSDWYQGTADAVRQNQMHFGKKFDEMLILSGDQLYQMDYQLLLDNHRQKKADMSIAVLPVNAAIAASVGILKVDSTGAVVAFKEKPTPEELDGMETDPAVFKQFGIQAEGRPYLASMGIYVFNRKVLFDELNEHSYVDFGKHLFPAAVGRFQLQAYLFDGYWEDIGTVKSFHEANLALAKMPQMFSFATDQGLVYTRPRSLPGAIAGRMVATDSIITEGCRVIDATLDQTILGIRSIVGRDVKLTRTLVMGADYYETDAERELNQKLGQPNVGIGDNVVIENAIVDKNARIGSDVIIKNPDRVQPTETSMYAVRDGVICIFKDAVVLPGTRIGV